MKQSKLSDLDNNILLSSNIIEGLGINPWPLLRHSLFTQLDNKHNKFSQAQAPKEKIAKKELLKYIFLTIKYKATKLKKKDICYFSSGVVNMLEDGIYVNRLYDYFYSLYPSSSVIIEESYRRCYRRPRAIKEIYYLDYIELKISVLKKIFNYKYKQFLPNINQYVDVLIQEVDEEIDYNNLRLVLYNQIIRFDIGLKLYKKYFSRINPKIVFLEDATYGYKLYLIEAARQLGIKTGEFQHGYVSLEHLAYNWGDAEVKNKEKYYLPDFFLTFGNYWSENIKIHSQITTIGFPYLSNKKKEKITTGTINILVVSDPTLYELYREFLINLSKELTGLQNIRITFKLHPGEVPLLKERYSCLPETIIVETYKPIYELLPTTDILIGGISTVIYEAIAFGICPFILDDARIKRYATFKGFQVLSNLKSFREAIMSNSIPVFKNSDAEYIWNANFDFNYKDFLIREGVFHE